MSAFKPAPLCALIMSTGKQCGSPAVRGTRFCYNHSSKNRISRRERHLVERLERLHAQLEVMDIAGVLDLLHQKLITLPKTLSRFPDVDFTLSYMLDRIHEVISLESGLRQLLPQYQEFAMPLHATGSDSNNLGQTSPESGI